ncbi:unnamed protein product [Rotaria socialis]|uniref:Pseudouridine synthase I TruA alpha/beta domain-containing protein n=3 Tax=Rotaria socialis TaxID=392032 RepID=A0A817XDG0_9BILA|nr:unnamed protein product [Rotaria socialis]CAF3380505.1 unnamed protein product [Rotaria socialis]CAF3463955.1 unnamed protein product [Rotaria socialis]CAF3776283.1 unnamed protein product [Rotaria socialis]
MSNKEIKNPKRKLKSDDDQDDEKWSKLSREQIIQRCQQLEKHVDQLRNTIVKKKEKKSNEKNTKSMRPFDFSKHPKRHIFLKFFYLGWEYHGFVVQETTSQTVEDFLFDALIKTRLIEQRATSNYHRCGRTDRGVSAFTQVISLTVRSKITAECTEELNYVHMLNGVLPNSIRCVAWASVPDGKSARFDCISRSYRYYFPKANLDLDQIRQAAADLVGTHDFRNFCKLDITNSEPTFIRRIDNVTVEQLNSDHDLNSNNSGYEMCELLVHGSGFLWHQIRCVVAILISIGQGKEDASLVRMLLDIEKYPCTPNYQIASELPLVLFDCQFDGVDWICDQASLRITICHLQRHWASFQIRATMIKAMLDNLENQISDKQQLPILGQLCIVDTDSNSLLGYNNTRRNYQPILTRPVRESVESKVEKFQNKKTKLETTDEINQSD